MGLQTAKQHIIRRLFRRDWLEPLHIRTHEPVCVTTRIPKILQPRNAGTFLARFSAVFSWIYGHKRSQ
jgi:hypothetical protein